MKYMSNAKFVLPKFYTAASLACATIGLTGAILTTDARAEETKVGVIMEARPAEQPWSGAVYDALQGIVKKDPAVKLSMSYKAYDPTTAEPVARQMIDDGAVIVDFHSFALNDVAHTLSKQFPKIPMAVSSFDPPVQPNLSIFTASYLNIGYSNCWLLAKLSKSGKIAYVAAVAIPYATEVLEGCKLGAAAANPKAEVLAAYGGRASAIPKRHASKRRGC